MGLNTSGQLGDGTIISKSQPVQVQGLSSKTVTAIAAGYSSGYFRASDGTVWAVGLNTSGQLGDGTKTNKSVPVQVQGLSSQMIIAVAAGSNSAYFLESDGTVWSVGLNTSGQLGDGTLISKSVPVQVQGLSSQMIIAVAAGSNSSYFLASDGTVWSTGLNTNAQLGDNSTNNRSVPVQVSELTLTVSVTVTAVNALSDINVANGTAEWADK
ncbi:BNR repeat domain protein [Desulfosporosinus sp. I2]|nr:BNR repeat domain protein [Desulfosporosinus sp. I2]